MKAAIVAVAVVIAAVVLAVGLMTMPASAEKDIVDTAIEAGSFNTLVAAVQAAGLEETLRSGTFTVFAPTDEAFSKLPPGTVESLLEDKEALTAILTYHVVPGEVRAEQVLASSSLETVNGQSLTVNGGKVDNANIVSTDIMTSNGVIHVIDSVVLPQ